MSLSDEEIIAKVKAQESGMRQKGLVKCSCKNWYSIDLVFCPYCKKFNAATTAEQCPACGSDLQSK